MSKYTDEITAYLSTKYSHPIKSIQSERYLFESGERIRRHTIGLDITTYLQIKYSLSLEDCNKEIVALDTSIRNKSKSPQKNLRPDVAEALANLRPAIAVKDPDDRFLVDRKTNRRSQIHIDFYSMLLSKKPKELFDEAIYIDTEYSPRDAEPFRIEYIDDMEIAVLNTYQKPAWFKSTAEAKIPTLFKDLIDHLIVNEESKEYFYDWLYKSLTDRAYTFLVLCGMKGIGKGQLQKLIRALHGRDNFVEGKRGTIDGQFNSQLENSRLIWFDEIHYDKPEANNLKRIMNDLVSIERKGVDATRSTAIHCSIVLSNNDLTDNYIELDDRRFSPLELTESKLTKAFSPKWFDEFNYHVDDLGENSPLVAEFGQWILENGKSDKIDKQEPYKGEKFKQIVISSLRKWQDHTLELLEGSSLEMILVDGSYTTYEKLRIAYEHKHKESGQYPKKNKIIEFLKAYESPETGKPIVKILYEKGKERIIPIDLVDQYGSGFREVGKIREEMGV
jgi:hypothetical protein